MSEVKTPEIPVDPAVVSVAVKEEDLQVLAHIQVLVDSLNKHRVEIGRLYQLLGNLREEANRIERDLAESRRGLSDKYGLQGISPGQWGLDFEKKEFVKTAPNAPVIP